MEKIHPVAIKQQNSKVQHGNSYAIIVSIVDDEGEDIYQSDRIGEG